MKRASPFQFLAGLLVLCSATGLAQAVPQRVSFTGNLNNSGLPASGTHTFIFSLFDAPDAGTSAWSETHANLPVTSGLVFAELGGSATNPVPLTPLILNGAPLFLEVSVDGTVLSPRLPFSSVPYAIRAGASATAESASGFSGGLAGDVTGGQGATVVAGLQKIPVAATAPTNGQVLTYNSGAGTWQPAASALAGCSWVNGPTVAFVSNTIASTATCPAGQIVISGGFRISSFGYIGPVCIPIYNFAFASVTGGPLNSWYAGFYSPNSSCSGNSYYSVALCCTP
jgi:hypothetical protein